MNYFSNFTSYVCVMYRQKKSGKKCSKTFEVLNSYTPKICQILKQYARNDWAYFNLKLCNQKTNLLEHFPLQDILPACRDILSVSTWHFTPKFSYVSSLCNSDFKLNWRKFSAAHLFEFYILKVARGNVKLNWSYMCTCNLFLV